jgi:3',5'-cyclic AMP phosphodiesterase CpdA
MRPITWLQISDIHMRPRDEWSQDIILRAMTKSIAQARTEGLTLDFALVTGDLAFSGKPKEYELVKACLTAISEASGVPREKFREVCPSADS